jgi:hypothetical protein
MTNTINNSYYKNLGNTLSSKLLIDCPSGNCLLTKNIYLRVEFYSKINSTISYPFYINIKIEE